MPLEYISAIIITVVCLRIFGHFERHTALPRRILKWSIYLAIVVLLTVTVGRPWSLIWTLAFTPSGASHTASTRSPQNREKNTWPSEVGPISSRRKIEESLKTNSCCSRLPFLVRRDAWVTPRP
jgi:hypothetical protein